MSETNSRCGKFLYKLFTGPIISTQSRLTFDLIFLVHFSESGTKVPKLHYIWANLGRFGQIWANLGKFLKSSKISLEFVEIMCPVKR